MGHSAGAGSRGDDATPKSFHATPDGQNTPLAPLEEFSKYPGVRTLATCFQIVAAVSAMPIALRGATLVADYQLQNTLASSVGAIGPLTVVGDPSSAFFTSDTVNGNPQQVLTITSGSPLGGGPAGVQAQVIPFLNPADYSAVLLANFDINPLGVLSTKIMDFKNLSTDAGLYVQDATGTLTFIDGSAAIQGSGGAALSSLTYVQIVLTRDDATDLTSVYLDGAPAFSFTDSSGLAVMGDSSPSGNAFLTLFLDDTGGTFGGVEPESTVGNIARLRLYDGVLTPQEVADLDTTIPVPEVAPALVWPAAAMLLLALLRHRK